MNHECEGLVRAHFPNGTAFNIFQERCERCRHCIEDPSVPQQAKLDPPHAFCSWGVLDRIVASMGEEDDHGSHWHDPTNLRAEDERGQVLCPPKCLRFTDRDDRHGELRDPLAPDVAGQLTFEDALEVPEWAPRTNQPAGA